MRRFTSAFLFIALAAAPSLAAAAPFSDLTWGALSDPGDDWAATVLRSVLPSMVQGGAEMANQRTVIGLMVGWLSGLVFMIAAVWTIYGALTNLIRTASRGTALHEHWHWMAAVRMPIALAFMFPSPTTGVSFGQVVIFKVAMSSIGAARLVYADSIKALGPDAVPIATPMIPGTRLIVSGLLQNELCRALVVAATNNERMMPIPQPITTGRPGEAGAVTWAYNLAPGNATGAPFCGTVTVRSPAGTSSTTLMGVSMDMTGTQRQILENVVQQHIRPVARQVADNLWRTRQAAALAPMMDAYVSATDSYTRQLTEAATNVTLQLRAAVKADDLRRGTYRSQNQVDRLWAVNWSGAGAYSMEFARLNGATLSVLANTPTVTPPSFESLGTNVHRDLVPLVAAVTQWKETIKTVAQTTDGTDTPGGYADLYSGASPDEDGASILEKVMRSLHLSERVLRLFTDMASPAKSLWQDPFADQVQTGHKLMMVSLAALGLAAILASGTGTAATMAVSALTLNFSGVAGAAVGHMVVSYLGAPIFAGLMSLLIPGMILAYLLPLLPFGLWLAGIAGWLVLVLEAWISVSLWMLAHLTFRDAALHGNGSSGYITLANIFFRPVLMLIGLFLGYVVYAALAWLISRTFMIAAGSGLMNGWIVSNIIGLAVFMCVFTAFHMAASTYAFRMISLVPHHVLSWANMRPANRVDMDSFAQQVAGAGMVGALQGIDASVESISNAARKIGQQQAISGPEGGDGQGQKQGMDGTLSVATDVVPPDKT
ncbi:hypothetical protein E2C06_18290 [Dankookia rubra]|uniref:DotA/TraY family protein n=2 Tax=cellular organisms TaxID=131567 RepID=A0A4R5QES4_9PROT|nr:DotA/TraY family protein [Dankookia rubra]TDH61188.1 hypothetical protein E2C06_18290 [Dankookia rubra]